MTALPDDICLFCEQTAVKHADNCPARDTAVPAPTLPPDVIKFLRDIVKRASALLDKYTSGT